MTVSEYAEFEGLYELDPWGDLRDDFRAAITAAAAAGVGSGRFEPARYLFADLYGKARRALIAEKAEKAEDIGERQAAVLAVLAARLPKKPKPK